MSTKLALGTTGVVLDRRLGSGASSGVWLGHCPSGERVAVKIAHHPEQRLRLAHEAERLLAVSSPHIVRLLDAGVLERPLRLPECTIQSGLPFLVLEVACGTPLSELLLTKHGSVELALSVARDIGAALEELHAAGFAHGDVKPENIVVSSVEGAGFRARLVDLGLSARADERQASGGTWRYLAPDLVEGGDARTRDVWALGLTLAEIVSERVRSSGSPASLLGAEAWPAPIADLITGALRAPGARPSAAWLHRRAFLQLHEDPSSCDERERRRRAVQCGYLAVRRGELLEAASFGFELAGKPADWLREHVRLRQRIEQLVPRGESAGGLRRHHTLRDLDDFGRSRWLSRLVGPQAASYGALTIRSDAALAERLLDLCDAAPPESWTLPAIECGIADAPLAPDGVVELALALGAGRADGALLMRAEQFAREHEVPEAWLLSLGRCLRLRGELGRALLIFERCTSAWGSLEAAETARRAGDIQLADRLLEDASGAELEPGARARRAATLARLRLRAGAPEQALALVAEAPGTAATLESRALAELALGARAAAANTLTRAESLASSAEERARLAAVAGSLAHAAGDAELALGHFRSASEHAAQAGAVLEEASYLTGVAAAATTTGDLAEALGAARRAILLFEGLGRAPDGARAALSRASAYLAAGALDEARDAAVDARCRARLAGDRRCEAYVELCCADLTTDPGQKREHAGAARALLADSSVEDDLWIAARLLRAGDDVDVARHDASARSPNVPIEARLDWWAARTDCAALREDGSTDQLPLTELAQLASERAPRAALGAALASALLLARRTGQGELARKLLSGAGEAARELLRRAPPELKTTLAALPWVKLAQTQPLAAFVPEQVGDVERLVRALARRDALQPLLDDVLDALVLWTGVERGLLLLRAPGGRLVPRAGRNLARRDLPPAELALSRTLAARALVEKRPIVAVDATRELPEVHASVHALKLRSVLALPLVARGESLGVVYLDDRVRTGAFGARELDWVHLLSSLAAVAIADARDQLLLRRAARRAERAERRLGEELAERQVQLELAERELARTRDGLETRFAYDDLIGQSSALRHMLKVVDRVTLSEVPVLLHGESGSGKELVARAIHRNGPRANRPFVTENCGAIPETLLEATLFGHVRGAFTGANRARAGLFEIADQGTLFLDEVAEMSLGMQTKLLRVLEDGEFRPLGAEHARRASVRVIAATHRDLEARVAAGQFREDLFYRLNVIRVEVPALRERHGDVPLLIRHFLERHASERKVRVSKPALQALASYAWPGNIRQLENEIRRALVLADSMIELSHLSPEVCERRRGELSRLSGMTLRERVDALEAELVSVALRRTQGNQTKAAELLGLSRFGLQKMMKRLDISPLYAEGAAK